MVNDRVVGSFGAVIALVVAVIPMVIPPSPGFPDQPPFPICQILFLVINACANLFLFGLSDFSAAWNGRSVNFAWFSCYPFLL